MRIGNVGETYEHELHGSIWHGGRVKLVSWNIKNGGGRKAPRQVSALLSRKPDLVVLQEFMPSTASIFADGLRAAGLEHQVSTLGRITPDALKATPEKLRAKRRYGVFIASRYKLEPEPASMLLPWPERLVSVVVGGRFELHGAYIPPGASTGWLKIRTINGIFLRLACDSDLPRLLVGDFNTPRLEHPDGTTTTWATRRRKDGSIAPAGTVRGGPGSEWDRSELQLLKGLARYDLPDIFRTLNGYDAEEYTWVPPQFTRKASPKSKAFRFDHAFGAKSLNASDCRYLHDWRESGLSDHSALELAFEP